MKQKSSAFYEIFLMFEIIACILLPQLIETTTVTDASAGLDEYGYPVTSTTLEDLEAPVTRFGLSKTRRKYRKNNRRGADLRRVLREDPITPVPWPL